MNPISLWMEKCLNFKNDEFFGFFNERRFFQCFYPKLPFLENNERNEILDSFWIKKTLFFFIYLFFLKLNFNRKSPNGATPLLIMAEICGHKNS